ncbi:hypothetical protein HPB50_006895 [Hyalomma asiaticum]|uniref:Uncharacterized protein n=1 Tax=Hyalomma asiaticum TaxID=266040 RepID=A0ACB7S0U0_HYAAI|nr:hypothetical protein HPB50_006895 [Hyalomma asiaticum]
MGGRSRITTILTILLRVLGASSKGRESIDLCLLGARNPATPIEARCHVFSACPPDVGIKRATRFTRTKTGNISLTTPFPHRPEPVTWLFHLSRSPFPPNPIRGKERKTRSLAPVSYLSVRYSTDLSHSSSSDFWRRAQNSTVFSFFFPGNLAALRCLVARLSCRGNPSEDHGSRSPERAVGVTGGHATEGLFFPRFFVDLHVLYSIGRSRLYAMSIRVAGSERKKQNKKERKKREGIKKGHRAPFRLLVTPRMTRPIIAVGLRRHRSHPAEMPKAGQHCSAARVVTM